MTSTLFAAQTRSEPTPSEPTPRETAPSEAPLPLWDLARFADAPAIVWAGGTLSHAQLADRVRGRAASWGPARRLVLIEGANNLDAVIAHLAAVQYGHVALLVPDGRSAQRDALAAAYDPDIVCRADAPDDVLRSESAHDLHPDLALLLSTSGSTGSPKLVRLSRENIMSNAIAIASYLDLGPGDRAITSLPLHYCYGLSVLHSHLATGASIALTDLSVVDECFWALFNDVGATSFAGVPHTFDLLDTSGFLQRSLPTLRQVTQAGGRLRPECVRRWSRIGREAGWDLVVMYGQTEATARMAWLPPELAETHPESIGRAIPGGHLRIDHTCDDRPGVGELIYAGPNVMLGYAHTPQDLGRGRDLNELPTGDLARERDGLFEIVGRRRRCSKVFGLRIDLDEVERTLHEQVHRAARVVGGDTQLHVFVPHGRVARRARALVHSFCGIPANAVSVRVLEEVPHTSNGKPDYHALQAIAELDTNASSLAVASSSTEGAGTVGSIRDEFVRVLGRPEATEQDTFVTLGGDSLSYVELATRLTARLPGGLPTGWHTTPIGELAAPTREPTSASRAGVRLDTTIALRALAILLIVATHVDVIHVAGGAHLLLAMAGFNFARFQLGVTDVGARLRSGLASLAQLVVPATAWIGAVGLIAGTYHLTTAVFIREWFSGDDWDRQWEFWFLEALVWLMAIALALTCVPRLAAIERRAPYNFALTVLLATATLRFVSIGIEAGPTERYRLPFVAFVFALGWLGARSTTTRQRLLTSALAASLIAGYFGEPGREALVAVGFLLVLWLPTLRVPRWMAHGLGVIAGASLFIYLTHWQVYPDLEAAGHPWLGLVMSVVVGVTFTKVIGPLQRTIGRAVRSAR